MFLVNILIKLFIFFVTLNIHNKISITKHLLFYTINIAIKNKYYINI